MKPGSMPEAFWPCANSCRISILEDRSRKATSGLKRSFLLKGGCLLQGRYLFTSESVTEGHPDKVADQVSDAVLDAILACDPYARVACETVVTTGLVFNGNFLPLLC